MVSSGPAKKVTLYINEDAPHHLGALHDAVMKFLLGKGVSGATATRAYSGFGSHQRLHTPKIEVLADSLPIRIEFVDTAEKVDEVLPALYDMVTDGLIEVQDTTVVKQTRKAAAAGPLEHVRQQGAAVLLRVYLGAADRWHDEPLDEAILQRLRLMEIAGATVYRGVLGYGAEGHEHRRTLLHPSRDLPVVIEVVDTAEHIQAAAAAIEGMIEDGLLMTCPVEMTRLIQKRGTSPA